MRAPAVSPATVDPAKPSQDFLGLIDGAIGCLPSQMPAVYPPVSEHTTQIYLLALRDDVPAAGLFHSVDQPPSWLLYLGVRDAAGTATRVAGLGGSVLHGPADVPGHGSFLVATDPTGGVIGFWQPAREEVFPTGVGAFAWAELNTRDGRAADEFFGALFGYEQRQVGDGETFDYTAWHLDGTPAIGRMRMGAEFPPEVPAHWMVYFGVPPEVGTDDAAKKVTELGGTVCIEPFDSPYGRIAVVADGTGATFSLIDQSRRGNPS